jgi:hypothetical protein
MRREFYGSGRRRWEPVRVRLMRAAQSVFKGIADQGAASLRRAIRMEPLESRTMLSVGVALAAAGPSAIFVPNSQAVEGAAIRVRASVTVPSGKSVQYDWSATDADGDAYSLPNGGVTYVPRLRFSPDSVGSWTIGLTVTETGGSSLSATPAAAVSGEATISVLPSSSLPSFNYLVPSSNPALPSGFNVFNPSLMVNTVASTVPVIAASDPTAQPNDNVAVTGSQFTSYTGANAYSDTQFLEYGQTTSSNATLIPGQIEENSADGAIVNISNSEPADSMYLLWAENSTGVSTPVAINQTSATWMSATTSAPGSTVSIYGTNLDNNQATPESWVYIQPASGQGEWAAVTSVSQYKVDFTVPTNLPAGTYQVWINNGLGGNYSWAAPMNLTVAPAETWPNQYELNVKNGVTLNGVTYPGATGNGVTDDGPAILAALQYIHQDMQGENVTLYFPAGTYLIGNEQIAMTPNIQLLGAGPTQTELLFDGNLTTISNQTLAGPFCIGTNDDAGGNDQIQSMTITYDGPSTSGELVRERDDANMVLDNVVLDSQMLCDVDWEESSNLTLDNATLIGEGLLMFNGANVQIDSTNFFLAGGTDAAIAVWNGHDISITNCNVQNEDPTLLNPDGYGNGRLLENGESWGSIYNEYLAGNSTINMAIPAAGNCGEQINCEGAVTAYTGVPISATAATVTVPVQAGWTNWIGLNVIVIDGDGLGQMRTVASQSVSGNLVTLTLDQPWNLTPDAGSQLQIGTTVYNCVYTDNSFQCAATADGANLDASTALELWSGGYGIVFDGNTTDGLHNGVLMCSCDTTNPCYFIQVADNEFDNCLDAGICFQTMAGQTGPNFVGAVADENVIDDALEAGIALLRGGQGESVSLAMIENNLISGSPLGVQVGPDPETLLYDNDLAANTEAIGYVNQTVSGMTTFGDVILVDNTLA